MANSYQVVVSDGTLTFVDVSVEYLDRSEIYVYENGVLYTTWTWAVSPDKRVQLAAPIVAGHTITIRRKTGASQLRHEFSRGAAFTAPSLDEDLKQALHLAQEAVEGALQLDFEAGVLAAQVAAAQAASASMAASAAAASASASAAAASTNATAAVNTAIDNLGIVTIVADGTTDNYAALSAAMASGKVIAHKGTAPWIIGTPITITSPILDTYKQLFRTTDTVTIDNVTVGKPIIRGDWFGANTVGWLNRAVAALPSQGGTIKLLNKTYVHNGHQYGFAGSGVGVFKDDVTIEGDRMPWFNPDCKALLGGTIIMGMLLVYANRFKMSNVGVDCGFNTRASIFGGTDTAGVTEAFNFSYNNDAIKASAAFRDGVELHNVIALAASPSAPVHSLLIEGARNVRLTGRTIAMYGTHGVVVKSRDVQAESLEGYAAGANAVLVKSDSVGSAQSSRVVIDKALSNATGPDGVAPYITATAASNAAGIRFDASGGNIDNIRIGSFASQGYPWPVHYQFGGAFTISSVVFGTSFLDGGGYTGGSFKIGVYQQAAAGQVLTRCSMGQCELRNVTTGYFPNCPSLSANGPNMVFGSLTAVNVNDVIETPSGLNPAFVIGTLTANSITGSLFKLNGTPVIRVGNLIAPSGTTVYSGQSPTLNSSAWTVVVGGPGFYLDHQGSHWSLRGLLQPTGAPAATLATIPTWARPATAKRFIVQGRASGATTFVGVTVGSDGVVSMNEGTYSAALAGTWISLDGVIWDVNS